MHGDMTWLAMADPMVWFFLLNVLDVLLTLYVLKHGGSEKNTILANWFAMESADVVLIRVKVALLCIVWLFHYFGLLPMEAITVFVVGYAGLALWNLRSVYRVWRRK